MNTLTIERPLDRVFDADRRFAHQFVGHLALSDAQKVLQDRLVDELELLGRRQLFAGLVQSIRLVVLLHLLVVRIVLQRELVRLAQVDEEILLAGLRLSAEVLIDCLAQFGNGHVNLLVIAAQTLEHFLYSAYCTVQAAHLTVV